MTTEILLQDLSAFHPKWEGQWEPAPQMLDFAEKWGSFHTPNGRLMSCAHRGDNNILYPENSLEGFLSVILAGADMVEADIHTTLDGELVIMHDDTLTRTTNVSNLRSEGQSWLPADDDICHWTLLQIRNLRLKMPDGTVTPYAVPTLRELISIAKDRAFITLDKWHAFSWEEGVLPLIRELNAYRTVLIVYGYPGNRVIEIREKMYQQSGIYPPYFTDAVVSPGIMCPEKILSAVDFVEEHGLPPILRGGEYRREDREMLSSVMNLVRGSYRIYAETLQKPHDNEAHWQEMVEWGYNIIMGNRIYDLLDMVKAQFS